MPAFCGMIALLNCPSSKLICQCESASPCCANVTPSTATPVLGMTTVAERPSRALTLHTVMRTAVKSAVQYGVDCSAETIAING